MKMKTLFAAVWLSMVVFCNVSFAASDNQGVDSYIESIRADTRADKVAVIGDVMQFNDSDAKIFWPVYRKYEAELVKVNDQRVALIKSYAAKYESLTDADAKTMIDQSVDFDSRRAEVRKKYAKEFLKAGLSPLTVARFIQLEHRLDLVIDIELAYELPAMLNKSAGKDVPNQ
jgi:hypothetical protein